MSPRPASTSRDEIVRATVALLEAEGLDRFSMRRLGASMGIDPMTIYGHLPDKAALFDAVVDHLWTSVAYAAPAPDEDWRGMVVRLGAALRRTLLDHPRLVPLIATRPAVTPQLLALMERMLADLGGAGLQPRDAVQLLDCVTGFVAGKVQGELQQPVGGMSVSPEQAMAGLSAETYPHLHAAISDGYGWAPDVEFDRGLRALVRGWEPDD